MVNTVASVGKTRLFAGSELGAARLRSDAIVVAVDVPRFTCETSASVPVLTDHRSTPHCAKMGGAASEAMTKRTSGTQTGALRIHQPPKMRDRLESRGWLALYA